jgi:hypothetical protein
MARTKTKTKKKKMTLIEMSLILYHIVNIVTRQRRTKIDQKHAMRSHLLLGELIGTKSKLSPAKLQ